MNIFAVSENPLKAASMLCDKHVVKMSLESAQMMSTVWHLHGMAPASACKPTHERHPCVVWAATST